MIAPSWLLDPSNKMYLDRILPNGKSWGDDEDPEDLAKKRRRVDDLKKEAQRRRRGDIPPIRIPATATPLSTLAIADPNIDPTLQ